MPDTSSPPTRQLHGLSAIADGIDLCLCDIWGVVHNGVVAHGEAVDALAALRRQGATVVLVTNAPRPHGEISRQLDSLGVSRASWDAIVTSGDVCRALIQARAGQPVFMLGPDRDLPLLAGLDAPRVSPDAASYVLCTGLFDDETETPADYADMLGDFARRGLTLICANPDLVVDRGGRMVPCAGSLALLYEEIGGEAVYAGKPHPPIYQAALSIAETLRGAPIEKSRICAVGDAIRTDIAGAAAFGVTSVMVMAGIHAQDLVEASWEARHGWFAGQTAKPTHAMPHLVW